MTEEASVITGKISDIKDFMFVITDKNGVEYALSFEGEKPGDCLRLRMETWFR